MANIIYHIKYIIQQWYGLDNHEILFQHSNEIEIVQIDFLIYYDRHRACEKILANYDAGLKWSKIWSILLIKCMYMRHELLFYFIPLLWHLPNLWFCRFSRQETCWTTARQQNWIQCGKHQPCLLLPVCGCIYLRNSTLYIYLLTTLTCW